MIRRRAPDAFEAGLFLPARMTVSFPQVLIDHAGSEALQPYPPADAEHWDPDRHLLDAEAARLDRERMAAEIARFHATRREASMLAMINIALPLGDSATLTDGQNYLLCIARDERNELGRPSVPELSRAGAAVRELICAKLGVLLADSVTVAADGDTLVNGDGSTAAVLGRLCPTCWYATRAALAQRVIDNGSTPVLGQGLVDPVSVAILYTLGLIDF
ncbi:hypothetical protein [Mycolicibacterium cosmeticum]|uniref:Uncharacterized protein n=1 Tax=Mycolicibacterium cosmeticum TaxID=258533 RepID=W9AWA2_MYCCO|nr:hypothetical protein [Mycolicibacterium cosmeticum]CDO07177.1 hypothetical protein BN977_01977 [Mycolicibacterium cosmeticum]